MFQSRVGDMRRPRIRWVSVGSSIGIGLSRNVRGWVESSARVVRVGLVNMRVVLVGFMEVH